MAVRLRVDDAERLAPEFIATEGLAPSVVAELDFRASRPTVAGVDDPSIAPTLRARAAAQRGSVSDALALLADVEVGALGHHELAAAAWTVSRIGPRDLNRALHDRIADGHAFLAEDGLALGPRELFVGMLAGAAGRLTDAIGTLTKAAEVGDRRNPFWGALARLELHRVERTAMLCALDIEGGGSAAAAQTFFAAGGYAGFLAQLDQRATPDAPLRMAYPVDGVMIDGARWSVGFGVEPPVEVKPGKGLRALRHLVRNPERRVSAVELDLVAKGDDDGAETVAAQLATALAADPTAAGLPEWVAEQLFDDAVRSRVSKLVRRTVARLASDHETLAAHLDASLETGYACRYAVATTSASWRT